MVTYYEDENCWFAYDTLPEFISVHVRMNQLTPNQYRKYLEVFAGFLNEFKGNRIISVVTNDKSQKLNELFGGIHIGDIPNVGKIMEFYNAHSQV